MNLPDSEDRLNAMLAADTDRRTESGPAVLGWCVVSVVVLVAAVVMFFRG